MQALILAFVLLLPADPPHQIESEAPSDGVSSALSTVEAEIEHAREQGLFEVPPPPVEELIPALPEEPSVLESDVGEATFYGGRFHGRRTASGERFDQTALTAAHRTYPFGTIVRVTNLNNGRSIIVRINDRGPFGPAKKAARKIIDVSRRAAEDLRFIRDGRIVARVEVLEWGE